MNLFGQCVSKQRTPISMAEKLPDEMLVKILSPILDVEDRLFADTSEISPFSQRSYSNSAILVVCQSWLRVCTPLLYNVVILRSTAQAQALAYALMRNKFLGLFIKKLRLEGGFGAAMRKILLAAPNITDLVLWLSILAQDSVVGLVKGLALINPTRLILLQNKNLANIQVRHLTEKLCDCAVTWANLKSVDLGFNTIMNETILHAFKSSQSVERLYVPMKASIISSLEIIASIPTLKSIEVKGPMPPPSFQKEVEKRRSLVNLIRYQGQPPSHTAPLSSPPSDLQEHLALKPLHNTNPFYSPMSSVSPDIQDDIWTRILEFALEIVIDEDRTPRVRILNRTRASLPRVSKKFKDLSTPILYRYPILKASASQKLARQLIENPSLAPHIRSLFHASARTISYDVGKILSRTVDLVRVHSVKVNDTSMIHILPTIGWDVFVAMSKASGSTLLAFHNICVREAALPQVPSVFDGFTKLRSLRWCSSTEFTVDHSISPACLATLESIHFTLYDKTFADVLCRMDLPSLSDVVFRCSFWHAIPFLDAHGSKIRSLEVQLYGFLSIFDLCPNMTLLLLGSPSPIFCPSFFICKTEHRSLQKLRLNLDFDRKALKKFYQNVDLSSFTALREIQAQFCVWPVNEREIALGSWHKWSEILSTQGVKLTDAHGRVWRPRLKKQPR